MKKNLALFLALSVFPLTSKAIEPDDINRSLFDRVHHRSQAVIEGVSFYYYTKADRMQILTELFHSIDADYALLEIKASTINLDFESLKKSSLEAEEKIADTKIEAEQSLSNLQFLDRVRKIVASFQDTHFSISTRNRLNPVLLPFGIAKADGKYIVVGRYRKLMAHMASADPAFASIEIGQEVLSIDGQSPEKAAADLEPYISASSKNFREQRALSALTFRSFSLPSRPYSIVEFKKENGSTIKLKFQWLYRLPNRGDQAFYFKEKGFRRYDDLRLTWNEEEKKWEANPIELENSEALTRVPKLADEEKFTDEEGDTVIKTGYFLRKGKAYALLQINSFSEEKVTDKKNKSIKFLQALKGFISKINRESIPLILDLRNNPGGNGRFPIALMSMLTEKEKAYASKTHAYRITRNIVAFMDGITGQETIPEELSGLSVEEIKQVFSDAISSRETHSSAFSDGDIKADEDVGGFSQKIVALISPNCVSACDITSALLKSSGRAILIGTPTNGTGAGFLSSKTIGLDSQWTDSFRVFQSQIPNYLFGLPGEKAGEFLFPGQAMALNMENKPIQPDISHESSIEDLLKENKSWIDLAIETLEK